MNLTYIPIEDVEVVKDDPSELVTLLEESSYRRVPAFLFVREEEWSSDPFYYVFGEIDAYELLERLRAEPDLDRLTRDQLFDLLNIHEGTVAARVGTESAEPSREATVIDDQGTLTGVWARAMILMAGPPGEEESMAASLDVEMANGGGEQEPVDTLFRRTPHLQPSVPEPLPLGAEFVANVYLDKQAPQEGESVEEIAIELPPEIVKLEIEVTLSASAHFELADDATKTLTMSRDDDSSEKLPFKVRVRPDVADPEGAVLTARFTYNHRPCGRVDRTVALGDAAPAAAAAVSETAHLAIDAAAQPADLTIDVTEAAENDGRHFEVKLSTTLIDGYSMENVPWNFGDHTAEYVTGLMNEFTRKGIPNSARLNALRGAGRELFDKAPDAFKELFWRLIDAGTPPKTIFVCSEEPNIPWELMRPVRQREEGPPERREPLGVEFAVGRWVDPDHKAPKQQRPIEDSYVFAPVYASPLAKAEEEAEWVCGHFNGQAVSPADRDHLDTMLAQKPVGLVHFVAHGKSEGSMQSIRLADGTDFTSTELGGNDTIQDAFYAKSPLIFLNACEVGRTTPTLVGAGGFAAAFITAGARGVVAPLWSVRDTIAHDVAVDFYTAALATPERPFADILKDIRAKAYAADGGEDTYAAYCFYGDPLTALAV